MVKKCCIINCKSESYGGCGISFHRFPKKEETKKLWLDVVPVTQKITKNSVICSLHFKPEDFHTINSRNSLKLNAVPSIFTMPNTKPIYVPCDVMIVPNNEISTPGSHSDSVNGEIPENKPIYIPCDVLVGPNSVLFTAGSDNDSVNGQILNNELLNAPSDVLIGPDLEFLAPGSNGDSVNGQILNNDPIYTTCDVAIGSNTQFFTSGSDGATVNGQILENKQIYLQCDGVSGQNTEFLTPRGKRDSGIFPNVKNIAVQTGYTRSKYNNEHLQRKVKILSQRLKRRDVKVKSMQCILRMLKKCTNYEEVKLILNQK